MVQKSLRIYPTRTVIQYEIPNVLAMNVTIFNSMFPDDLIAMSNPLTRFVIDTASLDQYKSDVDLYLEVPASHTVENTTEVVYFNRDDGYTSSVRYASCGANTQNYFGNFGDHVMIDWGYQYLASDSFTGAGKTADLHSYFEKTGYLSSPVPYTAKPVDGQQALAVAKVWRNHDNSSHRTIFLYGYDEVYPVEYFGERQPAYWHSMYKEMKDLLKVTMENVAQDLEKAEAFDFKHLSELAAKGGERYATLCALAYRQTMAAMKVTWNYQLNKADIFQKEISTDGFMNTVDVIYPSSPLFLHTNYKLLELMLDPVLRYANGEVNASFTDPYSPHQLGIYPVANHSSADQEKMPMENTGNMFLMLYAILQRNGGDTSFYYPKYWDMLTKWANYLMKSLPFPEDQLCTDDFMGSMPNNTNLAAKGIIALNAFSKLCDAALHDVKCKSYESAAQEFAQTWVKEASVSSPIPHTALSFSKKDTWSTKYNLLWQRILGLDNTPFNNYNTLINNEVAWYLTQLSPCGFPLDSRKSWVKVDWLSWAAALATNEKDYNAIMDSIYAFVTKSPSRVPFSDLYDLAKCSALSDTAFVSRPVVGGLYAKALL